MANVPPAPERYTVARQGGMTLDGVHYDQGADVPADVVARIPRVNALLSRRWLVPDPDPTHGKTASHVPQPTQISQQHRRDHLAG